MNLEADRAAIAAAASSVAGDPAPIRARPRYWQIARPGDAVVRLDNLARDESGFGFIATWQLHIAVAQDIAAAEAWIDAHAADLVDALAPVLVVTHLEPIELVLATGRVPAVLVEGTRAA